MCQRGCARAQGGHGLAAALHAGGVNVTDHLPGPHLRTIARSRSSLSTIGLANTRVGSHFAPCNSPADIIRNRSLAEERMHLGMVRVQNFRNLQDISVFFKPGLNVLVGENNIGKTNLLDAVRWALGVQSVGRDAAVFLDKDDRHRKPDGVYVDAPIQVTLRFDTLSFDDRVEFLDILNYDEAAPDMSTATIHCEWSYSETRERWTFRRWGGDRKNAEGTVSDELLQALPLTFLEALRDAERELAPGKKSRLARYLQTTANPKDREDIIKIGTESNKALKGVGLVKRAEKAVAGVFNLASGTDLMRDAAIRPAPTDFDRLVQTLRVLLKPLSGKDDDDLLEALDSNGLGYNNLIYIATVLAELQARKDSPCAHARRRRTGGAPSPATPEPSRRPSGKPGRQGPDDLDDPFADDSRSRRAKSSGCHASRQDGPAPHRAHRCCGLTDAQERQLRRVLDVTRASLLLRKASSWSKGSASACCCRSLAEPSRRRPGPARCRRRPSRRCRFCVHRATLWRLKITCRSRSSRTPIRRSTTTTSTGKSIFLAKTKRRASRNCAHVPRTLGRVSQMPHRCASNIGIDARIRPRGRRSSTTPCACLTHGRAAIRASLPIEEAVARGSQDRRRTSPLVVASGLSRSPQHGKAELAQALASDLQTRRRHGIHCSLVYRPGYPPRRRVPQP